MNTIDFGGRLAIHPGEALYLVGYSRPLQGAKKTARNLIYRNAYPLPLTIVAGHQRVLVRDLMRLTGNEESVSLAAVAPASAIPGDATVLDWSGHVAMPGLIDLHTHLVGDIQGANPAAPLLSSAARDALVGAANARTTSSRPTSSAPSRSTRTSWRSGSATASGSSTCARAPPSPPATSRAPSTSASTASSPPTSAG